MRCAGRCGNRRVSVNDKEGSSEKDLLFYFNRYIKLEVVRNFESEFIQCFMFCSRNKRCLFRERAKSFIKISSHTPMLA